jgi:ion channel
MNQLLIALLRGIRLSPGLGILSVRPSNPGRSMVNSPPRLSTFLGQHRFVLLFFTLLGYFLLVPIVHQIHEALNWGVPIVFEAIFFVLLLAGAVFSVSMNRAHMIIALLLGLPAILMGAVHIFHDAAWVEVSRHLFAGLFLGYTSAVIVLYVFASRQVTFNTVCASLCVYLLLGLIWAVAYSAIYWQDPASFRWTVPETGSLHVIEFGKGKSITAIYFSFSTLTTLGYGDIVPISPIARALTSIEAITGQLYLAVLVARLVGLNIAESIQNAKS